MTNFDFEIYDNRPSILKLADKTKAVRKNSLLSVPVTLGRPKEGEKGYREVKAMDECFRNVLSNALRSGIQYSAFPMFVGYGMLSNLSQEALIRAGVETIADEMTRKPIELYYDDEGGADKEDLINTVKKNLERFKVKEKINEALLKDGYFGGCLVYIDVGDLEDDEAEEPLVLEKETFKKGSFRGFKVIEPVNVSAGTYNTTDPTDEYYFRPKYWYILGRRYHESRFFYIAGNETPLLLKPAYNFFGIPQAQLALDYVAHFVANRESAQELLNKFSLTCFGTDLSQGLQQNGSWNDLVNRMKMFNKFKTNNGTFVFDKETEELVQLNTPLSGVTEIVQMSLNLLTAVWRIPKIKYIGEGEGGLNASSQEQMRSYYDYIHAMQEKELREPYEKIIKIMQLNEGIGYDEKLLFKFEDLWDMNEKERADLNKVQADRDAIYLSNGVVSQEEVRRRLSLDRNSGYTMIDVEDVPDPQENPLFNNGGDNEEDDKKEGKEDKKGANDSWGLDEAFEDDVDLMHDFLSQMVEDEKKEPKAWITVHGVHVPLFEGQSKEEAFKGFIERVGNKTKERKEAKNGKSESKQSESENDFGRIQEESRRMSGSELQRFHKAESVDEGIRERLSRVLGHELTARGYGNGNGNAFNLKNEKLGEDVSFYGDVDADTFHDVFEVVQKYLPNGDAVDVHDAEDYKDCKNYLTADGLGGFSIAKDGNLISVFNIGKGGFLKTIAPVVRKEAKYLDCFQSDKQKLADMYAKFLGFKPASTLDFNYDILKEDKGKEYADFFVKTYGEAPVVFMVNTTENVENKHFNKDQWEDAYNNQRSYADYSIKKGESFQDYASRYDDKNATVDSVLEGLNTYISEGGKTHSSEDMRKAIADVEKRISEEMEKGNETVKKYRVSGHRDSAEYTPTREKLHKSIVHKLLSGKTKSENPTFILLGGRGGSGKSKFKGEVYDENEFVVLDADKIKEMLPEYEGWNAALLHEESADILERALTSAKKRGLNVVLDATMNGINSTKRRMELFKNSGYRTEMHYMFLPRQKAARRAITRFVDKPNGRYVPIEKILDMKDNEKNFEELKQYADAYSFSNNDVPFGANPEGVSKSGKIYYKNGGNKWLKKLAS